MEKNQTTERYTLADLENWSAVAGDRDPPIRLGIFGDPIAHSFSPQMQNAALHACGIDMQYARFHIRVNELRSALPRSEEHTSELQSHHDLVCRLLLEKKKKHNKIP